MIVDERVVEDFLEHHGVKGMKWHRRVARKAAIAAGGATLGLVGRHYISQKKYPSVLLIGTSVFAVAGAAATRAYLDRHGDETLSQLSITRG